MEENDGSTLASQAEAIAGVIGQFYRTLDDYDVPEDTASFLTIRYAEILLGHHFSLEDIPLTGRAQWTRQSP
jgi:hypothetical protein